MTTKSRLCGIARFISSLVLINGILNVHSCRVIFVSGLQYSINELGSLAVADSKCMALAGQVMATSHIENAITNGSIFRAWLSDSQHDALWRMGVQDPNDCFMTSNGNSIATSWADLLDGTLGRAIDRSQINSQVLQNVWSSTLRNGVYDGSGACEDWSSSSADPGNQVKGHSSDTTNWGNSDTLSSCSVAYHMYCFEVPAPFAPTTPGLAYELPSDSCRTIFQTQTAYSADEIGGISGANQICRLLALSSSIPDVTNNATNFVALLSTSSVDALDNVIDTCYKTSTDRLIASDRNAMQTLSTTGGLHYLFATQAGQAPLHDFWSGSNNDLTKSTNTCSSWTSSSGNGAGSKHGDLTWNNGDFACTEKRSLLCIQGDAQAAVPPPPARYVFVGSNTITTNMSSSGGADGICRSAAAASSMEAIRNKSENFIALLSSKSYDFLWRLGYKKQPVEDLLPWIRTDGVVVAMSTTSLVEGNVLNSFFVDENGAPIPDFASHLLITASTTSGTYSNLGDCDGWSSTTGTFSFARRSLTRVFDVAPPEIKQCDTCSADRCYVACVEVTDAAPTQVEALATTVDNRGLGFEYSANNCSYVFSTSSQYQGDLGGHAGANLLCEQAKANSTLPYIANMGGTMLAVLSSDDVDIIDEMPESDCWRTTTNRLIATSSLSLFQSASGLLSTFDADESGNAPNDPQETMWTGSGSSGTYIYQDCTQWASVGGVGRKGRYLRSLRGLSTNGNVVCSQYHHIVCAQVPAPPTSAPTSSPTLPTPPPSMVPSASPTQTPTNAPHVPTTSPTRAPTRAPSNTAPPTQTPTRSPTQSPTRVPTSAPAVGVTTTTTTSTTSTMAATTAATTTTTISSSSSSSPTTPLSSTTTPFTTTTTLVQETTSSQDTTSTSSSVVNVIDEMSTNASNIGPIIGGVVGGCCLIVLVLLVALVYTRRKRDHTQNTNNLDNDKEMGAVHAHATSPRRLNTHSRSPRGNGSRSPRVRGTGGSGDSVNSNGEAASPKKRRRKPKNAGLSASAMSEGAYTDGTVSSMSGATTHTQSTMPSDGTLERNTIIIANTVGERIDDKYLVQKSDFVKHTKIGEGAFGTVYSGEWQGIAIAVKEVKVLTEGAGEDFIREAIAMVKLRPHPNVVGLLGVCRRPLCILQEFCDYGSLDSHLYGARKNERVITEENNPKLVVDIARGLTSLHKQSVIHRDIAARNVLLDEKKRAKVCDFGMAREGGGEEELYQRTVSTVGPVKWMAPEQLEELKFSKASDVFAFGVLLFEIYEREQPWKGVANTKVAIKVARGDRMSIPSAAPDLVGNVMHKCWQQEPTDRPTMGEVLEMLLVEFGEQATRTIITEHSVNGASAGVYDDAPLQNTYDPVPKAPDDAKYDKSPGVSPDDDGGEAYDNLGDIARDTTAYTQPPAVDDVEKTSNKSDSIMDNVKQEE